MTVGRQFISAARAWGKTRYLAEEIALMQDLHPDQVFTVLVPNAHHVDYWFDLCFEVGIDPSRLVIETPDTLKLARGRKSRVVGVDEVPFDEVDWHLIDPEATVTRSIESE